MVARRPDELDRNAVVVAEHARRGCALGAPGVEPLEPCRTRVLEALGERERHRGHDQQLDVGEFVRDAPGDAAGQHDLLGDGWKCGRDALGDRPQFVRTSRRHATNLRHASPRVIATPARQSTPPTSARPRGVSPSSSQPSRIAIGVTRYVVEPIFPAVVRERA